MYSISNFTKLDLHVHTDFSNDSTQSLKSLKRFLNRHKDFGFAICDHNEVEGAKRLKDMFPQRIIVGSEIRTREGEITGLFLKDKIPSGKGINWTIDAILVQGGLVYIPHPCCRLRTSKLTKGALAESLKRADLIEVYNSRNVFGKDDKKAYELALKHNIVPICGSDAHTMFERGRSYMNVQNNIELSADAYYDAIKNGTMVCRRSTPLVHVYTKFYKKLGTR